MSLQLIKDESDNNIGVFVPMNDWETIIQMHEDLKTLLQGTIATSRKVKLSEMAGNLSKETGAALLKYVKESRNEWGERAEKQFC